MDLRPPLRAESPRRLQPRLEALDTRPASPHPRPIRHPPESRPGHRPAVCRHPKPHGARRLHRQLRRCRPGGRAHPALGDAESRRHLPGEAPVDFLAHRRVHPRGFRKPERPVGIPVALRGRTGPCHRRLALGHERHPPLHPEIRAAGAGRRAALHRPRADPHARPHRAPATRDRAVQARALLGAHHAVPPDCLHRHERAFQQRGRGAPSP